jgi:hypothetical protein
MKHYFINRKSKKIGPFTINELALQRLQETDMVWTQDNADWQPVSHFAELQDYIIKHPPPTKAERSREELLITLKKSIWLPVLGGVLFAFIGYVRGQSHLQELKVGVNNEYRYWQEYETGLLNLISKPFRMVFTDKFYTTEEDALFLKLLLFSLIDFVVIYFLLILLGRWFVYYEPTEETNIQPENISIPSPEDNKIKYDDEGNGLYMKAIIGLTIVSIIFVVYMAITHR